MPQLAENESRTVQGRSGTNYVLKCVGGANSCSCPAWRNQSRHPNYRTCIHLLDYVGDAAEAARIRPGGITTDGMPSTVSRRVLPHFQRPTPQRAPAARTPGGDTTVFIPSGSATAGNMGMVKGALPVKPARNAWSALLESDPFGDEPPPPPPIVVQVDPPVDEDDEDDEDNYDVNPVPKLQMLLAETWDGVVDPIGMLMSEKLDGVRAYWTGERFMSRLNNEFAVPDWFLEAMPRGVALDGEFWIGRGKFQETSGLVRRKDKGDYWSRISFMCFDMPNSPDPFSKRISYVAALSQQLKHKFTVVEHRHCRGIAHLKETLAVIENLGGEGVMLRAPQSLYERRRSNTLLKVKSFYDAEGIVQSYQTGKGRLKGLVGALQCTAIHTVVPGKFTLQGGTQFEVGTGLSDAQRRNPPAIGSHITFRYLGLTDAGVPRHTSFVGVRDYEGSWQNHSPNRYDQWGRPT